MAQTITPVTSTEVDLKIRRLSGRLVFLWAGLAVVLVLLATLVEVPEYRRIPGVITRISLEIVRAPSSGTIDRFLVAEGDLVNPGQTLVSLDPRSVLYRESAAQLRLQESAANLQLATLQRQEDSLSATERVNQAQQALLRARASLLGLLPNYDLPLDVDRVLGTYQPGHNVTLDAAVSLVRTAESDVRTALQGTQPVLRRAMERIRRFSLARDSVDVTDARTLLESFDIRARKGGIVHRLSIGVISGAPIQQGTPIMVIQDPEQWQVTIPVSDEIFARLSIGDSASVSIPSLRYLVPRGMIARVSRLYSAESSSDPELVILQAIGAAAARQNYVAILNITPSAESRILQRHLRNGLGVSVNVLLLKRTLLHRFLDLESGASE